VGSVFWKITGLVALFAAVAVWLAWATSPEPGVNPATFEDDPVQMRIAPLSEAVTLAQRQRSDGSIATILVTALEGDHLSGIDLALLEAEESADPFAVLASVSEDRLLPGALSEEPIERFAMSDLLPAAPTGDRHIGTGTNFPEHADESGSEAVFQFPKFGQASPSRMSVAAGQNTLLDYEVEFCMRFDREIGSVGDFDAATKGLFLCGDFTDRAKLIRILKTGGLDDGRGFSDGKSREDFYPSGSLLVIPRDWKAFIASERMTTQVNGERRQDARGVEMELDFRALVEKALGDMDQQRFLYQDAMYRLAPQASITPEMTLMSGTSEGVIFSAPTRGEIIEGAVNWLLEGYWLRGESVIDAVIETLIANRDEAEIFLQPGDVVTHQSSRMGDIVARVTAD